MSVCLSDCLSSKLSFLYVVSVCLSACLSLSIYPYIYLYINQFYSRSVFFFPQLCQAGMICDRIILPLCYFCYDLPGASPLLSLCLSLSLSVRPWSLARHRFMKCWIHQRQTAGHNQRKRARRGQRKRLVTDETYRIRMGLTSVQRHS